MTHPRPFSVQKGRFAKLGAAFLLLGLATAASAASTVTNSVPPLGNLPSTGPSIIRVVGALCLVLGVFLGGVWLVRNGRHVAFRGGKAPRLNVLESRSLGGRQAVFLIGYEQERFLVAASPAGINLLSHLPPAPEGETSSPGGIPAKPSFAQALGQLLQGPGNRLTGGPK